MPSNDVNSRRAQLAALRRWKGADDPAVYRARRHAQRCGAVPMTPTPSPWLCCTSPVPFTGNAADATPVAASGPPTSLVRLWAAFQPKDNGGVRQ